MIKGVNKQVLEINETENGFFEKAIFFVKPEYSGMSEGKLKEKAKKELQNAGKAPNNKELKKKKINSIIKIVVSLAVGIVIGAIFASLL